MPSVYLGPKACGFNCQSINISGALAGWLAVRIETNSHDWNGIYDIYIADDDDDAGVSGALTLFKLSLWSKMHLPFRCARCVCVYIRIYIRALALNVWRINYSVNLNAPCTGAILGGQQNFVNYKQTVFFSYRYFRDF